MASSRGARLLRLSAALAGSLALIAFLATVAGAVTLPDSRQYELVTPPSKNGGDVIVDPAQVRVSTNGDAVSFSALISFADAHGIGIQGEYMSRRNGASGTPGWATHATFPNLDPFSLTGVVNAGFKTFYVGEFSDDLSTGILRTGTNLSGDPNLAAVLNLYLRKDLRTPGQGTYETVTICPFCVVPLDDQNRRAAFADATPDFGHVIFESGQPLVAGTVIGPPKVYEWDHGTLYLASVLPNGTVSPRGLAGVGATPGFTTYRTISDDGRRIFFTDNTSSGGSREGELYMRVDHTTTVQINATERTTTPDTPQPARFEGASTDGTKIYFTSPEALTDDDSDVSPDLYQYDVSKPANNHLTRLSVDGVPGDGLLSLVNGVLDVSEDGSYVYFVAQQQLVPGKPLTGVGYGIYAWHEGDPLRLVGTFTTPGIDELVNELGGAFGLSPREARLSPDGKHLLFTSHSGEGLGDYPQHGPSCTNEGCREMYLYDYTSDKLVCASCNPSGAPAASDSSITLATGIGASQQSSHVTNAVSDDGRYVFFTSGDRLVPEDQNGIHRDAYQYDAVTGKLSLLTSGKDLNDSFFLDATPDGQSAFVATRAQLLGWDGDGAYDIYAVRVNGGFPEPQVEPDCTGQACRGSVAAPPPALEPPSSTFFSGDDNVKHAKKAKKAKKCKRGKVRRRVHGKVKCVKKAHKSSGAVRRTK